METLNSNISLNSQFASYVSFYQEYFQDPYCIIQNHFNHDPIDLLKYRINILTIPEYNFYKSSFTKPIIQIQSIQKDGTIVTYNIIIGNHKLQIILLNFNNKSYDLHGQERLGKGGYGEVRKQISSGRQFAVKKQEFRRYLSDGEYQIKANKAEIQKIVIEYSIHKICSLYKIGPLVDTEIGFDLICYDDAIQFNLELCSNIKAILYDDNNQLDQQKYCQFVAQMKQNLYILHKLHLVHRDVKPANMLFSKILNKFVLSDFGLSMIIQENIGSKSLSCICGTVYYYSPELKSNIQKVKSRNQKFMMNLYENDRYALEKSLSRQELLHSCFRIRLKNLSTDNIFEEIKKSQKIEKLVAQSLIKQPSIEQQIKQIVENKQIKNRQSISINTVAKYNIMEQTNQYQEPQFISKVTNVQIFIQQGYYEYLKLKYYAIKSKKNMRDCLNEWQHINQQQVLQLLQIIQYSMEFSKIKEIAELIECGHIKIAGDGNQKIIKSIYKQAIAISNMKIQQDKIMDEEKRILNYLRVFGYCVKIKVQIEERCVKSRNNIKVNQINNIINSMYNKQQMDKQLCDVYIEYKKYDQALQYLYKCLKHRQIEQNPAQLSNYYRKIGEVFTQMGNYPNAISYIEKSVESNIQLYEQKCLKVAKDYHKLGSIYQKMTDFNLSISYYIKCMKICILLGNQYDCDLAQTYSSIGSVYLSMNKLKFSLDYYTMSLKTYIMVYGSRHPVIAAVYDTVGLVYHNMDKYQLALQYYHKSLKIKKLFNGNMHESIAYTFQLIGNVYHKNGQYDKALEYYSRSIKINIINNGQIHPKIANNYYSIGIIYKELEKSSMALDYYHKALKIFIIYYGQQHYNIGSCYYEIGSINLKIGKNELALNFYDRSMFIYTKFCGKQHYQVAYNYHSIGIVYLKMDKQEMALDYFIKSVKMLIMFRGKDHPDVANNYYNIGVVYHKLNMFEKSLDYYSKSMKIYVAVYGWSHDLVSKCYTDIGNIYCKLNEISLALNAFKKSLQICNKIHKGLHASIANNHYNKGRLHYQTCKYQLAKIQTDYSLDIYINIYGRQHPSVAGTYFQLGLIEQKESNYVKALQYFQQSLKIMSKFNRQRHRTIAIISNQIGNIYKLMGKYDMALDCLNSSLNILILYYRQNDPLVADIYNNLGIVYKSIQRYELALDYYMKCLKILISCFGQKHISVASCYHNIGSVFRQTGDFELALQYYSQSLKLHIFYYTQQHMSVADNYHSLAITYLKLKFYDKALVYCLKLIKIKLKFINQQHADIAVAYHLLSTIFFHESKYVQASKFQFCCLSIYVRIHSFDHPNVAIFISWLAEIYLKINKYIEAHYYYKIACEIKSNYFRVNQKNILSYKDNMTIIESSIPNLIHNYPSHVEFTNQINIKYSRIHTNDLFRLLLAKKNILKFEQQHGYNSMAHLKCIIELSLCYKYMRYKKQMDKYLNECRVILTKLDKEQCQIFDKLIFQIQQD